MGPGAASAIVMVPPGTLTVPVGVVVEVDVDGVVVPEEQAASTSAADATTVPTIASLVSFRPFVMIVLDLLDSNCAFDQFDG